MNENTGKDVPPKLAQKLLKSFCSYDFLSTALWDLEELYSYNLERRGRVYAQIHYWLDAFSVVFHLFFKGKSNYTSNRIGMIKTSFVSSLRNFRKDWSFGLINVLGLTLGLTAFIILAMYVSYELSYDKFHEDHHRIHRLTMNGYHPSGQREYARVSSAVPEVISEQIPEVEAYTSVVSRSEVVLHWNDKMFSQKGGYYVDQSFFDLFSFPVVAGKVDGALDGSGTMLITQSIASKIFGDANPVGEILVSNESGSYKVVAVLSDPPKNSLFRFSFLTSIKPQLQGVGQTSSLRLRGQAFLKFDPAKKSEVLAKIDEIKNAHFPQIYTDGYADQNQRPPTTFKLQPIGDIYLKSEVWDESTTTGDIRYLYIFSSIGLLILLIAGVNYSNAAVARIIERAREFGIRKIIGASKGSLVMLYFIELIISLLVCLAISLILIKVLIPYINLFLDKELGFSVFTMEQLVLTLIVVAGAGLVSGIYPAVFLSRMTSVDVLKGKLPIGRSGLVKKGLVTFQFFTAQLLIIAAIIIQSQLSFLQNTDIGYNREQLIYIPMKEELRKHHVAFMNDLNSMSQVKKIVTAYNLLASGDMTMLTMNQFEGLEDRGDENLLANYYQVGPGFVSTMGMELVEGADFDYSRQPGVVINEKLAETLSWADPVGKVIHPSPGSSAAPIPVVGVVRNFNDESLKSEIKPLMISTSADSVNNYVIARLSPENMAKTLEDIEVIWNKYVTRYPFDFGFWDEKFDRQYTADKKLGSLLWTFSALAMGLSVLGIFAISMFSIEKRMKEFSIRKVFGASVYQLSFMLNKGFLWPIAVAFLVAIPLAYYLTVEKWLQSFAFRIQPQPWIFVTSLLITLLLTVLTVSYHSLKLRRTNPVKYLRET